MKRHSRGNAAPETALVLSFTLIVLFGTIQLATATFYQTSADGAAFVAAHDTVATYGNPTAANQSTAKTSAAVAFDRILSSSIQVLNPSSSTFETDVSQQIPGISALGNPQALTVNSRLIEESAGTGGSTAPATDCLSSVYKIANGATSTTIGTVPSGGIAPGVNPTSAPIGLIGVGTIISTPTTSGAGISLTNLPIVNKIGSGYAPIAPDLTSAVALLQTLTTTLNSIPLVGSTIEAKLGPMLTNIITQSLSGTFNATSDLTAVNTLLNSIPGVGTLVTTIDSLLTVGPGGPNTGLLGTNGPLSAIATAETTLDSADTAALAAVTPACAAATGASS